MRDPREDDLPLVEIAQRYFGHSPKTVMNWVSPVNKYPFRIYQLGGKKSPWFVSRADFKRYRDQSERDGREAAKAS